MTSLPERFAASLEAAENLDTPAYAVTDVVTTALEVTGTASQPIQNVLHGTWLGHPLHPALATIPVGTWTMALALDNSEALGLAQQQSVGRAADLALKVGVAGAVAAAAARTADWRQVHGRERRTGLTLRLHMTCTKRHSSHAVVLR